MRGVRYLWYFIGVIFTIIITEDWDSGSSGVWVGVGVCDTLHSIVSLHGVGYMSTSPNDSTLYKCEVCNETFNTQQEIERHNKEKHIETAGQKE